jgi:hypothetical protein
MVADSMAANSRGAKVQTSVETVITHEDQVPSNAQHSSSNSWEFVSGQGDDQIRWTPWNRWQYTCVVLACTTLRNAAACMHLPMIRDASIS